MSKMGRRCIWLVALIGAAWLPASPEPEARTLPETPALDLSWWRGFKDPRLDTLLAEALGKNPDVRIAAARLGIAEAGLGFLRANRRPSLDLDAGVGVRKYTPTAKYQDPDINRPGLELTAGYAVDLWGRFVRDEQAGVADWRAAAEDVTSARLALAAEVGGTWFALRANRSLLDILGNRLDRARELLAVLRAREGAGLDPVDNSISQTGLIAQLELELSALREIRAHLDHRLSSLRGLSVTETDLPAVPPLGPLESLALPPDLNTGLLAQRPDVRAAALRIQAEQGRVGVAKAGTLPSLTLLGKGFFTGDSLRELLRGGSLEGFLAAQVKIPFLDGGRSRTQLDSARASLALAAEEYSAVVVRAFEESADALSNAEAAQARLGAANRLVDASTRGVALVEQRKAAGLADRLAALRVQDHCSQAQEEAVRAQLSFLKAQIEVALALAIGAPR